MLLSRFLRRRHAPQRCEISLASPVRQYSRKRQEGWTIARSRSVTGQGKAAVEARKHPRKGQEQKKVSKIEAEKSEENLYEQLFGPSNQDKEQSPTPERDVPTIPFESQSYRPIAPPKPKSYYQRQIEASDDGGIGVLVLRNASKNLVEEDFRRLIPQGSHLEGWTLEQGDIIKVIAGRDLDTLEQQNYYYLLFSSRLSAFSYQGHATRVHKIVAAHTPSSILSPMMPPPGSMAKNMDAHTAIQSFSLAAPNQELDLRQLKPPLTPMMQAIVRNRGYPTLSSRKTRMPFEARLTLEGPQLHDGAIRHFFRQDGADRQLSWSGSESNAPTVSKWVPAKTSTPNGAPSPMRRSRDADLWGRRQKSMDQTLAEQWGQSSNPATDLSLRTTESSNRRTDAFGDIDADKTKRKWVKPSDTFIVGFATQRALQSFVQYWHRRPMETERFEHHDIKADVPPIIHVEPLW